MKIIEPLSSALLLTGCVYAAGVAQNNALMRQFGINPAFSQPAIDKIFYDGGLITFEIFYQHISAALPIILIAIPALLILTIITTIILIKKNLLAPTQEIYNNCKSAINFSTGTAALLYLIYLTFTAYTQARSDGIKISKTFVDICHPVKLEKDSKEIQGCAFNKDRDSIWYYTIQNETPVTHSKLLSELDQITYLEPKPLDESD